jgi:hypothetical protein
MNSLILNNSGSFDRISTLRLLTSDNCNKSEHEAALDCSWQNMILRGGLVREFWVAARARELSVLVFFP